MHSEKCAASQYFHSKQKECVPCEQKFDIKPGCEFSPNCGLSDDGGQHERPHIACPDGKFNDGTFLHCKQCSTCPAGLLLSACNATNDCSCCVLGQYIAQGKCNDKSIPQTKSMVTTNSPLSATICKSLISTTTITKTPASTVSTIKASAVTNGTISLPSDETTPKFLGHPGTGRDMNLLPAIFVVLIILLCFLLVCVLYFIKKRKCGNRVLRKHKNGISFRNHKLLEEQHLTSRDNIHDLKHLLSAEVQAAPLQTVLNNLDVVEELVVLLDPEISGVKNTRHLAAKCSMPFTWINYTYSMKESRSPLVMVLEKVITSHPYWTVGHLADLLSKIGRNDAVAVLKKLAVGAEEV